MASEILRSVEILKAILELSVRQTELALSESFEELLECQAVRVELFSELKELGGARELKALADEILESDRALARLIAVSADELKTRLEKIGKGSRAAKAYASF